MIVGLGKHMASLAGLLCILIASRAGADLEAISLKKDKQKSQRLPFLNIAPCDAPPTIDGALDDKEWSAAAIVTGFVDTKNQRLHTHQPKVYITYDNDFLYLGVTTPLYEGMTLLTTAAQRDEEVWRDDCLEIFLDPTPDTRDYYHIVVNSTDTLFDEYNGYTGVTVRRDVTWNMRKVKLKSVVGQKRWTMETAIPFSDMGLTKAPENGRMLFSICETRSGLGGVSICRLQSYHARDKYGVLTFHKELPVIRMHDLGSLHSAAATFNLSYSGQTQLPVSLHIEASRYDEHAAVFFPMFNHETALGKEPRVVFSANQDRLGKHGRLVLEAKAGSSVFFTSHLFYETSSAFEVITMRVLKRGTRKVLRVATRQPFVQGLEESIRIVISDGAGKVFLQHEAAIEAAVMNTMVEFSSLQPRPYVVSLEKLDRKGAVLSQSPHKPDFTVFPDPPPWHNNQLGISKTVPHPWIPITVETSGNTVSVHCWNKSIVYDGRSLLPAQIEIGREKYLSFPMAIRMKNRLSDGAITNVFHRVGNVDDRRAVIESWANTSSGRISTRSTIDFDGFIWTDLHGTPADDMTVTRLAIQWDMQENKSSLFNSGERELRHTGHTPKRFHKKLEQWHGPFWVGNEKGGIAFAVESFEGWHNERADHQMELSQRQAGHGIQVNIVSKEMIFDAGKKYTYGFCFQITPVRPRPNGYRKKRSCSIWGRNNSKLEYAPTFSLWNNSQKYRGEPSWETSEAGIKEWCINIGKKYRPAFMHYRNVDKSTYRSTWFACYSSTARNSPEAIWAAQDWVRCGKDKLYGSMLMGYYEDLIAVCKVKEYQDYFLWKLDQCKTNNPDIDGLYFDLSGWHGCDQRDHGHGWTDEEGNRRMTYQIREHREWLLRMYTYLKARDVNTPLTCHLSGHSAHIMGYAFCDYLLDGELWVKEVGKEKSYKDMPLDTFRAEALCHIYGPGISWISQLNRALMFTSSDKKRPAWAFRHLIAMALVHDMIPPHASYGSELPSLWRILDRFDLADSDRLLPYWEEGTGIELHPGNGNIVATGYAKNDAMLLVVFNNTDSAQRIIVELDARKIFGRNKPMTCSDAEKKQQLAQAGENRWQHHIGMRNFALLIVE